MRTLLRSRAIKHAWTAVDSTSVQQRIFEFVGRFAANCNQPHEFLDVIRCCFPPQTGVMGKTTPILRMTSFLARRNDRSGVRTRLAKAARATWRYDFHVDVQG